MRTFHKPKQQKKFYPINFNIQAANLRVINEKGEQIGILSKQDALKKAQEVGLDLVLIAPKANPPVAKIIDFKKFLYQEEKKAKEGKKGVKKSITKDINLGLFIASADLERFKNKVQEFLSEGHQVRINLTLKGREIVKKEMAFDLINRFLNNLENINIAKPPKLEGRVIRCIVAKKK